MGYDRPMHVRISARLILTLTAFLLPIAADSAKALSHPGEPETDGGPENRNKTVAQQSILANRHAGGLLTFDVRDAETGLPIPCKLTFVGEEGTQTICMPLTFTVAIQASDEVLWGLAFFSAKFAN